MNAAYHLFFKLSCKIDKTMKFVSCSRNWSSEIPLLILSPCSCHKVSGTPHILPSAPLSLSWSKLATIPVELPIKKSPKNLWPNQSFFSWHNIKRFQKDGSWLRSCRHLVERKEIVRGILSFNEWRSSCLLESLLSTSISKGGLAFLLMALLVWLKYD